MNNLNVFFKENNYKKITCKKFYREIFPIGSFQEKGIYQEGLFNGIIIEMQKDKTMKSGYKIMRYTLTDDLELLNEITQRKNFCICSAVSYAGRSKETKNARELFALVIEIDDLIYKNQRMVGIENLFQQIKVDYVPTPTFTVCSGHGIHLYFVFEKPIKLFKNNLKELEKLKKALTSKIWNGLVSSNENIQFEPVCQAFRMVGTTTKIGTKTNAYRTGDKISIEYLNGFVDPKEQAILNENNLTLKEAKEKYPKWYQKRIENNIPKSHWICNKAVYEWWQKQIYNGASCGHRYWCLRMLAIYGIKCGIQEQQVIADILSLLSFMKSIQIKGYEEFTKEDCISALSGYGEEWRTYPIEKISYRSGIVIQKNKRNKRKQSLHLKIARSNLNILNLENGSALQGRPSKQEIVKQWKEKNPNGTKANCIKETKLAKSTIYKWW